jgi:hypothetical protein
MELPKELAGATHTWADLSSWERAELGRAIRELGWSYAEIMSVIPVSKATLSNWCREVSLTESQKAAILARTGSRKGMPRDTQRKRRAETERIRSAGFNEVPDLITDPLWLAGTVMYWAEGAKSKKWLALANSDPRALILFIDWVRANLMTDAEFVFHLHLHEGNSEQAARAFWERELRPENADYHRTYFKPPGTGHRKNHLKRGVLRVGVRRSTDAWYRVMGWIDGLCSHLSVSAEGDVNAIVASGR